MKVINQNTKMAGSSGGGITATMFGSRLFDTPSKGINVVFDLLQYAYELLRVDPQPATPQGLAYYTEKLMDRMLPPNANEMCSKQNVFIHMTKLKGDFNVTVEDPGCLKQIEGNLTVSAFETREQLINAQVATSFVANFSQPKKCGVLFEKDIVNDGGYSLELPW